MDELIEVRDLYKSFGNHKVLKGLNIKVSRGSDSRYRTVRLWKVHVPALAESFGEADQREDFL